MRPRHHMNLLPLATVYGSPSMSQPPSHASNSPKGRSRVDAPRRGEANDGVSICGVFDAYHSPPASSMTTLAPAFVSAYAARPPPAPDPTMQTSYSVSIMGSDAELGEVGEGDAGGRERIGRLVVLDVGVLQSLRLRRLEDGREVDRAGADVDDLPFGRGARVLQVQEREAARILRHEREGIAAGLGHPVDVHLEVHEARIGAADQCIEQRAT